MVGRPDRGRTRRLVADEQLRADGQLFGNAFSEKGSNAVGSLVFNTRLLPDPAGGYRLDGEKFYSTGTLFSDYLTVTATNWTENGLYRQANVVHAVRHRLDGTGREPFRGTVLVGHTTQAADP